MANPHISYEVFKSRFGDLGITEWTKYNYLSNYNFGLPAQTEVPSEYLELEWLRSVNTTRGYIDTQYIGKDNTSIILDITIYENTNRNLIGNIITTGSPFKGMVLNTYSSTQLEYLYRNSGWHIVEPQQAFYEKRSKIEYSQRGIYLNGAPVIDLSDITGNIGTGSFFLFSRNRDDISDTTIADAAIYNLKFYEGSELVRDFHPVKRLSDGQLGLYDTVTNTFVAGTGTFTAGPMKQRYVRVEYVQFNGDDYLDTGLVSTVPHNWVMNADVQFTSLGGAGTLQLQGAGQGLYWGFGPVYYWCQTYTERLTPNVATDTDRHHIISQIDTGSQYNYLYIDGVAHRSSRPSEYGADLPINIGDNSYPGSGHNYCNEKVYSYKIYEDNILLRNFVPVYDLVTEKYGLYDMVEGKFYGSANGLLTGPFSTIRHFVFEQRNASNISWYGEFQGLGTFYIDRASPNDTPWTYTWGYDLKNEWYYSPDSLVMTYREQNANHPNDTHNMNRGYVFVPPTTEEEARAYLYAHPIEFWLFAV